MKKRLAGDFAPVKKHYCPDHPEIEAPAVLLIRPRRRMMYRCKEGCLIPKGKTIRR